jgi:RNA polymerase subunit RPABC4/transcription elongation factor Spt4
MTIKIVKTQSIPCPKCGSKDFSVTPMGARACIGCNTYLPIELRDIRKIRK